MAVISIDYDKGHQDSYRAVEVKLSERDKTTRFEMGDPVSDFVAGVRYAARHEPDLILLASSCDQFVMDGDWYEWAETDEGNFIRNIKPPQG